MVEARRHILAILQDYPSLRPPIDHLCELLPRLQARYYSIASSSKVRWEQLGQWLMGWNLRLPTSPVLTLRARRTAGKGTLRRRGLERRDKAW